MGPPKKSPVSNAVGYGIKRLLLQGGGLVDGSFANEDLVDELSLVVAPAIDCGSSQYQVSFSRASVRSR